MLLRCVQLLSTRSHGVASCLQRKNHVVNLFDKVFYMLLSRQSDLPRLFVPAPLATARSVAHRAPSALDSHVSGDRDET